MIGETDRLGTLEPGRLADVAAYRRGPISIPVDELRSLRPAFTMVGGHVVRAQAREHSLASAKTR